MKALVTGSSGFIGSNLTKTLRLSGIEVLEIDKECLSAHSLEDGLVSTLESFNPDVVFHVGANSNTLERNFQDLMYANLLSTEILSQWCLNYSKKLIFSSSASVYGSGNSVPLNLYAWSKFAAERIVISRGGVALRYFNVYGPGESHKGKMASVFFQAFLCHLRGNPFELFPGKPTRDFIHVDDVVSANICLLDSYALSSGHVYDVGTGLSRTFEEGLEIMQIPFTYLSNNAVPQGYQYKTVASEGKWIPKWRPIHSLESGLTSYLVHLNRDFDRGS